MNKALQVLLLATTVLSCSACSTSYTPQPRAGIAQVVDGGRVRLMKNGQLVDQGFFALGGDLVEAVEGNPRALEHAESHRSLLIGGFVVTIVGAAGVGAGVSLAVSPDADEPGSKLRTIGLVTAASGLAIEIVGLVLNLAAIPHRHDAINIYNDDVAVGRPPAAPATRNAVLDERPIDAADEPLPGPDPQ